MLIYLTLDAYRNLIFLSCCCCCSCQQWSTHPLRLSLPQYIQSGQYRPIEHPLTSTWTGSGLQAEWALALPLRLVLSIDVGEGDGGPTTEHSTDVGENSSQNAQWLWAHVQWMEGFQRKSHHAVTPGVCFQVLWAFSQDKLKRED